MNKKVKLIISVVLIVGIGIGVYFGFFVKSDEEKILERLETFEKAYAGGDLTGCIDCLDSKNRNAYKALGNLGSNIGGSSGLFSFNLGGDTFKSLFSLGVAAQDEQLKFNVKAIKFVDKTHAIVFITNEGKKQNVYVNISAQNIVKYPDGTLKWGSESADDFDFQASVSDKSIEDVTATSITSMSADYDIKKITV